MTDKDRQILQKILSYISEAMSFVEGMDFDSFMADRKTISAEAFTIGQIGELVNLLSEETENAHPQIPWKSIRGMRNRIIHDYENVDLTVLWSTVTINLPELQEVLALLLAEGS